jgi:hypothetical protein
MARKFMSYDEAIEDNRRMKEEQEAAEAAALEVRKKYQKTGQKAQAPAGSKGELGELEKKRHELADAEAQLKADPTSKKLQKAVNKLNDEIDKLEDAED